MAISSNELWSNQLRFVRKTDENKKFSITTAGHWSSKTAEKAIDEPNESLLLRSEVDIDLHAKQVTKKGSNLINDFFLSCLGTFKNKILEELKNANYKDHEDMVYRMQLTNDENIDILDLK